MSFQSFTQFLGFYLNRKKGLKRWLADWVNGADVALAWRLRGVHVGACVADRLGLKRPGRSRPSDLARTATIRSGGVLLLQRATASSRRRVSPTGHRSATG